jgi:hypothetical protein
MKLCKHCGLAIADEKGLFGTYHTPGSKACLKHQVENLTRQLAIERAAHESTLSYNSDEAEQESKARTLGLTYD